MLSHQPGPVPGLVCEHPSPSLLYWEPGHPSALFALHFPSSALTRGWGQEIVLCVVIRLLSLLPGAPSSESEVCLWPLPLPVTPVLRGSFCLGWLFPNVTPVGSPGFCCHIGNPPNTMSFSSPTSSPRNCLPPPQPVCPQSGLDPVFTVTVVPPVLT